MQEDVKLERPKEKLDAQLDEQAAKSRLEKTQISEKDALKDKAQTNDKPDSFYSLVLKANYSYETQSGSMTGRRDGGDYININIRDNMVVNGSPINDGLSHRGVFPIDVEGAYFKWVDATVQVNSGGTGSIEIHGLSPNTGDKPPGPDRVWYSPSETSFTLHQRTEKLHADVHNFSQLPKEVKRETVMKRK